MIQHRACSQWGHFACDCKSGQQSGGMLYKWCILGNHKDADCPKQKSVSVLEAAKSEEEVLAITQMQARKLTYPDVGTGKERLDKAKKEIQDFMDKEGKLSTQ